MKHLFFLGLGVSPLLSSLLAEAIGVGLEAAGWLTTTYKERQQRKNILSDAFHLQQVNKMCSWFYKRHANMLATEIVHFSPQ